MIDSIDATWVTWTGVAGLRFEAGGAVYLIDPYYTRIGILKTLLRPIVPDKNVVNRNVRPDDEISAIIVGYTHSDHVLDVPCLAANTNAKIVGSRSLETLMRLSGITDRTVVCSGGETVVLPGEARVTMIRSTHGLVAMGKVPFNGEISPSEALPMKAGGYRCGTVFLPKFELQGTVFLHVGSANFIEAEMDGHTCDVLFLCVAGWKRKEGYPERLIDMTRAKTVVLFHFEDFSGPAAKGRKIKPLPFVDLKGMVHRIRSHSPRVNLVVPKLCEKISL